MKNFLWLLLLATSSMVQGKQISLLDENYNQSLKQIQIGQKITFSDVAMDHLGTVNLKVVAQKVFADDAKIVINTDKGVVEASPPLNQYFSGQIEGMIGSHVFFGILEGGKIEGVVTTDEGSKYALNWQQSNEFKLISQNIKSMASKDNRWFNPVDYIEIPSDQVQANKVQSSNKTAQGNTAYYIKLAVETDFEFYNIFGNSTDTVNYIAGLIGYISSIYTDEIDTSILVGNTSIWSTSSDPWIATNTECALYEVGKYWNDNNLGVDRALTHFISGKSSLSGIAWVGVLCNAGFLVDLSQSSCDGSNMSNYAGAISNYGGNYGVSSGLSGTFNPNNPQVIWDSVVVSHELGHNFNSPHTHCYEDIGGNSNPVDECNNSQAGQPGCYTGAQSLPGPSGQGSGTIMSYCHLLSPGLSNISLTLGTGHPFGTAPIRVPNRMRSHVDATALSNPLCIVPLSNLIIFEDGFEGT
ncbi:M12 family metallo-peptidase [Marinicella litoralis]|uniref:Metallopeptidase family M12-like protein n=1 Tax=Marinicella litoralis TaxID=644220 RepID=A0A4R6XF74_9GAMM|nr:M12 family metallo-peptidase [Marinicella litoralis]TDR16324.1 metallopeptidase family M12-like protein [Marinicella litoralis]